MLVNRKNSADCGKVKFISYTGEYPCLCMGHLTLEIDGEIAKFGFDQEYPRFWSSGGMVTHDKHWNWDIQRSEWRIDVEDIPDKYKKYAAEIDEVFNLNVPYGCCGGCI